ncbi:MAG: type II toxin-antitoxin system VapC family toxin [Actinobacteria bacterium]|nr:type II toxin-antitoxin system VapC family toxin [Actinomycetota bacterium]
MNGYRYNEIEEQINSDTFIISENIIDFFSSRESVVIDTSVMVKWFFKDNEKNTAAAGLILEKHLNDGIGIISPEIAIFELANVVKGKLNPEENRSIGEEIIDKIFSLGIIFYINKKILKNAFNIAVDTGETVYDCIFIATAEYFGIKMVTDDNRLFLSYSKYRESTGQGIEIILLKDYI